MKADTIFWAIIGASALIFLLGLSQIAVADETVSPDSLPEVEIKCQYATARENGQPISADEYTGIRVYSKGCGIDNRGVIESDKCGVTYKFKPEEGLPCRMEYQITAVDKEGLESDKSPSFFLTLNPSKPKPVTNIFVKQTK